MNKEEFQTKKNDIDSKIRELKNQKIQLEKEYIESNQVFPIGSKVCITVMDHERILVPEVKKLAYIEDYANLIIPNNSIIYCDIPYQGTKQYEISKNFDYVRFWEWCRQKVNEGHKVFVSEYYAPNDFVCIWEHELKTSINQTITKKAVERLFVHESQI